MELLVFSNEYTSKRTQIKATSKPNLCKKFVYCEFNLKCSGEIILIAMKRYNILV